MCKDVTDGAVNFGSSLPALLVMEPVQVSDACQNQSMTDPRGGLTILREPGDRPDRARNEEEPVGITKFPSGQKFCQKSCNRQPGEIVVGKRWMARVARNQNLIGRLPGQIALSIG